MRQLEQIAEERLEHCKTSRHVDRYGPGIELLGAAGELAARRFLGLPEELHNEFDGGKDMVWHGLKIDVETTVLTSKIHYRYLQWPYYKSIKADIILMVAVDTDSHQATVLGYAIPEDIKAAPVNTERYVPCHEIPIPNLRPAWELAIMDRFCLNELKKKH